MNSKSKNKEEDWKELTQEGITQFKTILNAIDRFNKSLTLRSEKTKGSPRDFKLDLLKAKDCRIYVKATEGNHVFLIYAEIIEREKVRRNEFIFIDGIGEAKEIFEKQGLLGHPVFDILNLSDIVRNENIE
ncbi:LIC_13246 family protein [Leptospira interrogans]|uniref:LIC_13246 family protein n=1 Tax=Leptospira interrogans TaxID=173 RepID=UPI0002BBA304|nr:hypothetical protein [Leptospira interrogans]EMN80299.1 hypothetical protein LEP1GSC106_2539 [Leptospira interrogans serovar Grippotyphosa str. UI 12764]